MAKYGYIAKIGVDTSGLQNGLKEVDSSIRSTETEINQINRSLKQAEQSGADTAELQAQKLEVLKQQYDQVSDRLSKLNEVTKEMEEGRKNGTINEEDYRAWQREIINTTSKLQGLEKQMESVNGQFEKTNDSTSEYESQTISLGAAINGINFDDLTKSLDTLSGYFDGIINKLKSLATETASYGDTVDKQSQRLEMTTDAYQEWSYILSQNGSDISVLTAGMRTLTKAVSSNKDAFDQLGLSADQLSKMTGEEQFSAVITALQGMENITERNTIANDLLGRSYQQLIPLLNSGADSVENLRQKAHDTNQILGTDGIVAAVNYTDALDTLNRSVEGFKNELGAEVLPVLTEFIIQLTDIINGASEEEIKEISEDIIQVLKNLADGVQQFVEDGGIEKVIESIEWLTSHTEEITAAITIMANAWVADKVIHFAEQLKIIPQLMNSIVGVAQNAPVVIKSLGTTFTQVGSTISTAMSTAATTVGVSCAAMTAAAVGAVAAIAAAIAIAHELEEIGSAMTDATIKAEESQENVQKMQNDVSDIKAMDHSLDQYDKAIKKREELQKSQEDWAKRYKDTNDEIAALEDKKIKSTEETARLKRLYLERDNLDVEFEMYNNQYARLESILNDYSDKEIQRMRETKAAVEEVADSTLSAEERTSQALKLSNSKKQTEIQNQEDALTNYYKWLDKQRDLHKISEEEYYEESEKWLTAHNYTESQAWWKHKDEYDKYLKSKEDAAKKEEENAKKQREATLKEQTQAAKDAAKKRYEALERQRDESDTDEFDDEWFLKELKAMADSFDKKSDLYEEYNKKYLDAKKKADQKANKAIEDSAKEEISEWKKSADAVKKTVESKYKSVEDNYNKAKSELMGALDLTSEIKETEQKSEYALRGLVDPIYSAEEQALAKSNDKAKVKINDLKNDIKDLKDYQKDLEALKKTGISDEHMANIMSMSYSERSQYVDALMAMSDKQRKKYYAEYEEYSKLAGEVANESVAAELQNAEAYEKEAEKWLTDTYKNLSEEAKSQGKASAEAYLDGFAEVMGSTNKVLADQIAPTNTVKSSAQTSYEMAQTYANALGGTASTNGGQINIFLDGKKVFDQAITDYVSNINYSGGMVSG